MKIRFVFLITFLSLLVSLTGRLPAQQVTPSPDQQQPAAPVTQWPQHLDSPDGLITIYQPQPSAFEGDTLTARAAVSLTPTGSDNPEFGAMWFTARVSTDRDQRIVTIQNITIKNVKLPNSPPDQETKFGQLLEQQAPGLNLMLSLDQLESTVGLVQKAKQEAQQLDNTPPNILFVTTPTTLVLLDGQPKLQATQDAGVLAVVNTPFIMLFDSGSKRYFLKAGEFWMVSPDVLAPWSPAGADVPAGVVDVGSKLTDNSTPQTASPTASQAAQPSGPPQIMVAEQPTELIATQGEPTYTPLPSNDLLYMSNTQSDVFMEVATQQYFVLLSGRWYSGKSLQGPWGFVASDKLPAAFAQIPADSPKANVLVSVADTQQAKDARMDAFIPQTTAINRDSGSSLNVTYDGDPQFATVENSPVTYASNCADPVLNVGNVYYCCHQAVWYHSPAAIGPWIVCDSVPQAIYTLPPSCPVYNCRYVYVYGSTANIVYCGYLPGYTGCYVFGPTVVFGTGYHYPFWYRTQFIPRPYTWGFGAAYDFYAGTWGFGTAFGYSPAWFANRPDHHGWFGPQGYIDYRDNHDRVVRITDNHEQVRNVTINRINIYNRQENVRRNINVQNSVHIDNARPLEPARKESPAEQNNVYVGQDGGIYRRTETGWETHDAKGWTALKSLPDTRVQPQGDAHAEKGDEHADQHIEALHPAEENVAPHEINTPETHARETPVHEEPDRSEPAEHYEQPGLEQERAARDRGAAQPSFRPAEEHSAPVESHSNAGTEERPGNNGPRH